MASLLRHIINRRSVVTTIIAMLTVLIILRLYPGGTTGFPTKHQITSQGMESNESRLNGDGGNTETSEMRLSRLHTMCQKLRINQGQDLDQALRKATSHILVDERHKTMYCFVPKAGCTSWKGLMMMMASGHNASYFADWGQASFHSPGRHRAMNLTYLSSYGEKDRQRKLNTYFKFMFIRNPFARLVSVYNDRFKYTQALKQTPFGQILWKLIEKDGKMPFPQNDEYLTFSEFASYIGRYDKDGTLNRHWHTATVWCQPCLVHYDYLGKQETMGRDTFNILSKIGRLDLLDSVPRYNAHGKGEDIEDYFKTVPTKYFNAIKKNFKNDTALFGYSMPVPT